MAAGGGGGDVWIVGGGVLGVAGVGASLKCWRLRVRGPGVEVEKERKGETESSASEKGMINEEEVVEEEEIW